METSKNAIISSVVVAVVVIILIIVAQTAPAPQVEPLEATKSIYSVATSTALEDMPLETFAACLSTSSMKFYGAFWCPHCQDQKDIFKTAQKKLPYVECAVGDGRTQSDACKALRVESYPTWIAADGTRLEGVQSIEKLAEVSACPVPKI